MFVSALIYQKQFERFCSKLELIVFGIILTFNIQKLKKKSIIFSPAKPTYKLSIKDLGHSVMAMGYHSTGGYRQKYLYFIKNKHMLRYSEN